MIFESAVIQVIGLFILMLFVSGIVENPLSRWLVFILNLVIFIDIINAGTTDIGSFNYVSFLILFAVLLYHNGIFIKSDRSNQ